MTRTPPVSDPSAPRLVFASRVLGVALFVLLALAGLVSAGAPAGAVTGTAGPVTVNVNPTDHPGSGTPITVVAQVDGAELFEIQAHLCQHGVDISNTFDFSFASAYCTPTPLAPDTDAEVIKKVLPRVTEDRLTFRLGLGTSAPWTDFNGQSHTLTCDASHLCDVVLQFQVTDTTVFYAAPLDGSTPAPPTTPPSTANPPERPAPSTVPAVPPTGPGGATVPTAGDNGSGTTVVGSTPPGSSSAVSGTATPNVTAAGAALASGSTGGDGSSGPGAALAIGALVILAIGAAVIVVARRRVTPALPEP